ncbi:MAG TPA: hypothetical protein VM597_30145 [Gemmataceae bacterium]|nr:hypothetical protein [Gemmataceae bacterium]
MTRFEWFAGFAGFAGWLDRAAAFDHLSRPRDSADDRRWAANLVGDAQQAREGD